MGIRFTEINKRPQDLGINPISLPSQNGLTLPKNFAMQEFFYRLTQQGQQRVRRLGTRMIRKPYNHLEHLSREANRGPYLEYGRRAAEGLRVNLYNETPYGKNHEQARKGAETKSHGISHEARLWDWTESLLLSKEFPLQESQLYLIPALWISLHDADQLDGEQQHLAKPKHGHDFAAALHTLVFAEKYQHEAVVSKDDARLATGIAAGLMLYHDEPKIQQKLLDATEKPEGKKAYTTVYGGIRKYLSADELLKIFEDDNEPGIDLFSLQDWQIADLTRRKKSEVKGLVTPSTPYGLNQQFEHDFADSLAAIDNIRRIPDGTVYLTPEEADQHALVPESILSKMSPRKVAQLRKNAMLLGDILRLADQLDMVAPPDLAMTRKWEVPISKERPLYRDGSLQRILHGISKLPASEDSDFGRGLWETHNMTLQILPREGQLRPSLDRSSYVRHLVYSLHTDNIRLHQEIFPLLMQGGLQGVAEDSTNRQTIERRIHQIFETDLKHMTDKLIKQAGLERRGQGRRITDARVYSQKAQEYLRANNRQTHADTLEELEGTLHEASQLTMNNLDQKNNQQGLTSYSQDAIKEVHTVCEQLLTLTRQQFQQLYQHPLPTSTMSVPFSSYHSTVRELTPAGVRTIRPYQIVA